VGRFIWIYCWVVLLLVVLYLFSAKLGCDSPYRLSGSRSMRSINQEFPERLIGICIVSVFITASYFIGKKIKE